MPRPLPRALWVLLALGVTGPAFAGDAELHLRAGAAHFRAGRYEEAVVEFKVARELGAAGESPWYVAAALTRAGRHLEALEAFDEAAEVASESADALFLYYRGVACSETQLVTCAAESFERASRSAGPKVAEQARRLAAEALVLLTTEPPRTAIDALLTRAADQGHAGRGRLVRIFGREALALSTLRADRWREADSRRLAFGLDAGSAGP